MAHTYQLCFLLIVFLAQSWSGRGAQDGGPDDGTQDEASSPWVMAKRHSEGTFTSDFNKYLEAKQAKEFVLWLMNNNQGGAAKRHADGAFSDDLTKYLDKQAAKNFISWLSRSRPHGQYKRMDFVEDEAQQEHNTRKISSKLLVSTLQ
uniref:glucagon-2-like n=1 Tax=Myxine glutinosa TaxID=7769 RepID=UPI00358EA3A6